MKKKIIALFALVLANSLYPIFNLTRLLLFTPVCGYIYKTVGRKSVGGI
ncbi:MAG: hypothetical protein J6W54_00485 [Fibrobacter sp.]|nr:hypothetical protein [Fibrobacter sp.]MBO7059565.1 hypothetical protein [Fibrobacter sp.]